MTTLEEKIEALGFEVHRTVDSNVCIEWSSDDGCWNRWTGSDNEAIAALARLEGGEKPLRDRVKARSSSTHKTAQKLIGELLREQPQ